MKNGNEPSGPSPNDIKEMSHALMQQVLMAWPEDQTLTQQAQKTPSIPELERMLQGTPDETLFQTLMSVCEGEASQRLQSKAPLTEMMREVYDHQFWEAVTPHWPETTETESPTLTILQESFLEMSDLPPDEMPPA